MGSGVAGRRISRGPAGTGNVSSGLFALGISSSGGISIVGGVSDGGVFADESNGSRCDVERLPGNVEGGVLSGSSIFGDDKPGDSSRAGGCSRGSVAGWRRGRLPRPGDAELLGVVPVG